MYISRLGFIMQGVEKMMAQQETSKGKQQKVKAGPYEVDLEVAEMLQDMKLQGNRLV